MTTTLLSGGVATGQAPPGPTPPVLTVGAGQPIMFAPPVPLNPDLCYFETLCECPKWTPRGKVCYPHEGIECDHDPFDLDDPTVAAVNAALDVLAGQAVDLERQEKDLAAMRVKLKGVEDRVEDLRNAGWTASDKKELDKAVEDTKRLADEAAILAGKIRGATAAARGIYVLVALKPPGAGGGGDPCAEAKIRIITALQRTIDGLAGDIAKHRAEADRQYARISSLGAQATASATVGVAAASAGGKVGKWLGKWVPGISAAKLVAVVGATVVAFNRLNEMADASEAYSRELRAEIEARNGHLTAQKECYQIQEAKVCHLREDASQPSGSGGTVPRQ